MYLLVNNTYVCTTNEVLFTIEYRLATKRNQRNENPVPHYEMFFEQRLIKIFSFY